MPVYVASDLHLDEHTDAELFNDERQGRTLAALCDAIARDEGSELILLGDCFDFTAMQPPERGLDRFFRRLHVPKEAPPRRSLAELLTAVRAGNPVGFEALSRLSQKIDVTVVPGNHDHHLSQPDAQSLLAQHGVRARIERFCARRIGGRTVVLQHGHEFDSGNDRPGGSGEILTNALHQAVIPWLKHKGAPPNIRIDPSRVVALRPEEAVVSLLQRWTDEAEFRRFWRAFLTLLAENRYVPAPVSFLAGFVSAKRVRTLVSAADRLWERTAVKAFEVMKGRKGDPAGAPRPDVLVLGHTHVIDWAVVERKLYVNLGTWTERAFDASSPRDASMPLLKLEDRAGALKATLTDLSTGVELQRYESPG